MFKSTYCVNDEYKSCLSCTDLKGYLAHFDHRCIVLTEPVLDARVDWFSVSYYSSIKSKKLQIVASRIMFLVINLKRVKIKGSIWLFISTQSKSPQLWRYGGAFVHLHICKYTIIAEGLAYFTKTLANHILYIFQQHGSVVKQSGC